MARQHGIEREVVGGSEAKQMSEIPDKLCFRIGEVARMCGVPTYVLRFWEAEFPQLRPCKGASGQRLYRRRDVELAMRVRALLYDDGYTIPGARQMLQADTRASEAESATPASGMSVPRTPVADALRTLRAEMQDLLRMLSHEDGTISVRSGRRSRTQVPAAQIGTGNLFDRMELPAAATRGTEEREP